MPARLFHMLAQRFLFCAVELVACVLRRFLALAEALIKRPRVALLLFAQLSVLLLNNVEPMAVAECNQDVLVVRHAAVDSEQRAASRYHAVHVSMQRHGSGKRCNNRVELRVIASTVQRPGRGLQRIFHDLLARAGRVPRSVWLLTSPTPPSSALAFALRRAQDEVDAHSVAQPALSCTLPCVCVMRTAYEPAALSR